MKKHKFQKDILYISISSFVLVALWIGFSIYHAYVTSTVEPDIQPLLEPIDPVFDSQTIESLRSRQNVNSVYTLDGAQTQDASPESNLTPQANPSPASTESGIPTQSGELIEIPGV